MKLSGNRIEKTAVFVGCARDCAHYLPAVLSNIRSIADLFSKSAFVFVENDSRDDTKQILREWCSSQSDARIVSLDGLAGRFPQRTNRLAATRNEYLGIVKSEYQDFDFMFVLDCDDVSANAINGDLIVEAVQFIGQKSDRAAVFANASGFYYDLWALRKNGLCPSDVWEELCDYVLANSVSDDQAYDAVFRKYVFQLDPLAKPVEVNSAFGGLGIYRIASILRNRRNYVGSKTKLVPNRFFPGGLAFGFTTCGWQICEHVSFNLGFNENNEKIYILPNLINHTTADASTVILPASFWRSLLFRIP